MDGMDILGLNKEGLPSMTCSKWFKMVINDNTVKSRFNEWPPSAHLDSLNRDFVLKRDFLMSNSFLGTAVCTLNQDFTFLYSKIQLLTQQQKQQQQQQ